MAATRPFTSQAALQMEGEWFMVYSTQYRSDRFGCVSLEINAPNEKGMMQSVFRYVPINWYQLINVGIMISDGFYMYYDISGSLYRDGIVDLDTDFGKILLADDNFSQYFVLYTCRKDAERFLDLLADEVHIFTRTGDSTNVDLYSLTQALKLQMPNYDFNWENLRTSNCEELDFWTTFTQMFTDPEYFWR